MQHFLTGGYASVISPITPFRVPHFYFLFQRIWKKKPLKEVSWILKFSSVTPQTNVLWIFLSSSFLKRVGFILPALWRYALKGWLSYLTEDALDLLLVPMLSFNLNSSPRFLLFMPTVCWQRKINRRNLPIFLLSFCFFVQTGQVCFLFVETRRAFQLPRTGSALFYVRSGLNSSFFSV